jgi:hypothetical protein
MSEKPETRDRLEQDVQPTTEGSTPVAEKHEADRAKPTDPHRDLLTGHPGAHPLGTGIGAAVGGAAAGVGLGAAGVAIASGAAAGTAVGTAAGPVGAVTGAVIGGIVGGLAGKHIAESVNPSAEDTHWREHHRERPYYEQGTAYEEYQPAYRYGWESRERYPDRDYGQVEPHLESGWEKARDRSRLGWDKARHAVRDAWDRVAGRREDRPLPPKG